MATKLTPTPADAVKRMIDRYAANQWQAATGLLKNEFPERQDIQEAKSTWLRRADLESFLDDNNANGLRIYYGAHDQSTIAVTAPFEYLGLHNVIFVATRDTVNPDEPTLANSIDQLFTNPINTGADGFAGMAGDITPLCPPNCPPPPPPGGNH